MTEKRGRGRPKGAKDKEVNGVKVPRHYRRNDVVKDETGSVEDQLRQLKRPARVGVYAEITGLSEAFIRKRVKQGKIVAHVQSGVTLIEPGEFLRYYLRDKKAA
jgi:hypothetical protein